VSFPGRKVSGLKLINRRKHISRKLNKAIRLLEDKQFCVLTGAGVSTASGIPDYRGMGTAPKKPLNFEPFMLDEEYRKDFWADGYKDWVDFSPAQPNDAHIAIANLQNMGFVNGVITQNVDNLHWVGGEQVVAELHGNMYTTSCLACGHVYATAYVIHELELGNPSLLTDNVDRENFWIPNCWVCGGIIKPDVVFFGEALPQYSYDLATQIARDADGIVVAGTSMNVLTPLPFVQMMKQRGKPVIIINKGKTLIDDMADVKLNMDISEVFVRLEEELTRVVVI
jgi:NAD-dependent SIR2 family protein deacetylase